MFVRFVVGTDAENAYWLTGVIAAARILGDEGRLFQYELSLLAEIFEWFNENLPCPPFEAKIRSGEWSRDAVSWFRDDAGEPLRRIWDIIAVLEDNGMPVRLVTAEKPGRIVYADEYQIVAETPPWA